MDRYESFAPFYDTLSGEWPVYGAGRRVGIELLRLKPGMTVLDLGCGTGLNFPGLGSAVGPHGRIIGVDRSPAMLVQAQRRGLSGVTLMEADLAGPLPNLPPVDAVITTYVLSLIPDWHTVWSAVVVPFEPGTRV
ncbi:methyltransferase domain-containing protein [Arthrobacter sp. H5]|uniref:class I SAM-dependent DNA methyltransferase n=1 Tax=Arthrobacter sp. H5 TaxID=1267973 RepID=UPI0004AF69F8|nr:methyltransferase domain-containing protein [Arthrobacter sp. H5]